MNRSKKLIFGIVSALLGVFIIELFSFLVIKIRYNQQALDPDEIAAREKDIKGTVAYQMGQIEDEMLHPYTGFAINPAPVSAALPHGWFIAASPEESRSDSIFHIGITGGSVAGNFHRDMAAGVGAFFQTQFPGKKVRVSGLAVGGYKQPQQYLTVSYLVSLGYHFDVLINLDGFNDVVLPITDNLPQGTFFAYPRAWKWRLLGSQDRKGVRLATELEQARARIRSWNQAMRHPLVAWSQTGDLLRRLRVVRLLNYRADIEQRMKTHAESDVLNYPRSGPENLASADSVRHQAAVLWRRSSVLLNRLMRLDGGLYFHFLQPNQYISGSKPFSLEEQKTAFSPGGYGPEVEPGYALLRQEFSGLREAGVVFSDLTMVFKASSETLYTDSCCHFNPQGNALIFEAMKSQMLPYLIKR